MNTLGAPDDGCSRGTSCKLLYKGMFSLMFSKILITDTCPREGTFVNIVIYRTNMYRLPGTGIHTWETKIILLLVHSPLIK